MLLVPLDGHQRWYRYHQLFRDMLRPSWTGRARRLPALLGRAAAWYVANGRLADALAYSIAAGEVDAVAQLRAQLAAEQVPSAAGASFLTAAELRILPMLATHLSFPEIAAQMFVSPHTVKSQAVSLYRKLGASSRGPGGRPVPRTGAPGPLTAWWSARRRQQGHFIPIA